MGGYGKPMDMRATKTFGGKIYKRHGGAEGMKKNAEWRAKDLRSKGLKVRVQRVAVGKGQANYYLWTRE